jgi:hypothetical protein
MIQLKWTSCIAWKPQCFYQNIGKVIISGQHSSGLQHILHLLRSNTKGQSTVLITYKSNTPINHMRRTLIPGWSTELAEEGITFTTHWKLVLLPSKRIECGIQEKNQSVIILFRALNTILKLPLSILWELNVSLCEWIRVTKKLNKQYILGA